MKSKLSLQYYQGCLVYSVLVKRFYVIFHLGLALCFITMVITKTKEVLSSTL